MLHHSGMELATGALAVAIIGLLAWTLVRTIARGPVPELPAAPQRRGSALRWRLFQSLLVFSVVGTNIQWHWAPEPYNLVPAFCGVLIAGMVTLAWTRVSDWWHHRTTGACAHK